VTKPASRCLEDGSASVIRALTPVGSPVRASTFKVVSSASACMSRRAYSRAARTIVRRVTSRPGSRASTG
jgi:hypothetical protein